MRNLKKVLSLALALVMLLGMMVVGAGATEFKDASDIKNTEAVAVVSGIGVLQGDENGSFNPEGTLSRAEAAVVIAKLDLGAAFGNLATTNASTFKDVGAGYGWAKPYIDYCAARGLIAGDGNGHFMPDQKVSGVQFALMVCRVLGYEDANEQIGGDDWAVEAAALARKAGLTVDVVLADPAAISRDDMAQVAFNALQADMVEYKQSAITIGNVTIPAGKASAVVGTKDPAKDYRATATNDDTKQLCEEKFPNLKKVAGSPDDFGRPASHKWEYRSNGIYTAAKAATITFTKATSEDDVLKAIKGYKFNSTTVASKTTAVGTADPIGELSFANASEAIVTAVKNQTGNGTLVELFADSSKNITDVVVVPYSVGKVSTVTTNKDGDVRYSIAAEYGFTSASGTNYADPDKADTAVVDGEVAKDDIVTYTVENGVLYIYPTTSFDGAQKSYNTTKRTVTVNGEAHDVIANVPVNSTNFPNSDDDATFFVDQYGFVVKSAAIEQSKDYAIIDAIAAKAGTGLNAGKTTVEARLVFPDGTSKNVTVSEINGLDVTDSAKAEVITTSGNKADVKTGSDSKLTNIYLNEDADDNTALEGAIVTYNVDGNNYELTFRNVSLSASMNGDGTDGSSNIALTNSGTPTSGKKATVKGTPSVLYNSTTDTVTATSSTKFVIKTDANKWESYEGFRNVATVTAGTGTFVSAVLKSSGDAELIYIVKGTGGSVEGTTGRILFVTNEKYEAYENDKYYVFEGIVDGEPSTVKTKETSVRDTLAAGKGQLFELSEDGEGYIKAGGATTLPTGYTGTVLSSNVDTDEQRIGSYVYDDTATVYVISDYELTEDGIGVASVGDTIYVKTKTTSTNTASDSTVDVIYIVKGVASAISSDTPNVDAINAALESSKKVTLTPAGSGITINDTVTVPEGAELTINTKVSGSGEIKLDGGKLILAGFSANNFAIDVTGEGTVEIPSGTISSGNSSLADYQAVFNKLGGATETRSNTSNFSINRNTIKLTGAGNIVDFGAVNDWIGGRWSSVSTYSFNFTGAGVNNTTPAIRAVGSMDGTTYDVQISDPLGSATGTTDGELVLLLPSNLKTLKFTIATDGHFTNTGSGNLTDIICTINP